MGWGTPKWAPPLTAGARELSPSEAAAQGPRPGTAPRRMRTGSQPPQGRGEAGPGPSEAPREAVLPPPLRAARSRHWGSQPGPCQVAKCRAEVPQNRGSPPLGGVSEKTGGREGRPVGLQHGQDPETAWGAGWRQAGVPPPSAVGSDKSWGLAGRPGWPDADSRGHDHASHPAQDGHRGDGNLPPWTEGQHTGLLQPLPTVVKPTQLTTDTPAQGVRGPEGSTAAPSHLKRGRGAAGAREGRSSGDKVSTGSHSPIRGSRAPLSRCSPTPLLTLQI